MVKAGRWYLSVVKACGQSLLPPAAYTLRYISCVVSLCCQGIPPGYRIDTARQQITTLVETKKNAQLWL
jgi:hypothetical protein